MVLTYVDRTKKTVDEKQTKTVDKDCVDKNVKKQATTKNKSIGQKTTKDKLQPATTTTT